MYSKISLDWPYFPPAFQLARILRSSKKEHKTLFNKKYRKYWKSSDIIEKNSIKAKAYSKYRKEGK